MFNKKYLVCSINNMNESFPDGSETINKPTKY